MPARVRLASLLSEAAEAAQEQAALTATKQAASQRVLRLITDAQRVATGIRRLLKEHYGIRSEKLAEFGLQPFRGRARRADPEDSGTLIPKPPPPTVEAPDHPEE